MTYNIYISYIYAQGREFFFWLLLYIQYLLGIINMKVYCYLQLYFEIKIECDIFC